MDQIDENKDEENPQPSAPPEPSPADIGLGDQPIASGTEPAPTPEPTPEQVQKMKDEVVIDPASIPTPAEKPVEVTSPAEAAVKKPAVTKGGQPEVFTPHPPSETADELDNEEMQHIQDMATGRINPKTYKTMWADKSTPGKIMTLFGLALSGIGAGLSRQPNMLLEMMNKEIERDMAAQQQNKTGARDFLSLQYQHDLQKAQARRIDYENKATEAETKLGLPAKVKLNIAQADALDAQMAGLSSKNSAINKAYVDMIGQMSDVVKDNPAGQALLNDTIVPAVMGKIQQNNADTAAKTKLATDVANKKAAEVQKTEGPIYEGRLNKLIDAGRLMPDMKGVIPPGEVSAVMGEVTAIKENRAMAEIYNDSFRKLDEALAAGKMNKQFRDAEMNALGAAVSRATAGRYSQAEAAAQASGMFPDWKDYGQARGEKHRKTMEFFKGQEAGTAYLDRYKLKTPFPDYKYGKEKKGGNSVPVTRDVNGRAGLFDPISKEFIKWKDESQPVAKAK